MKIESSATRDQQIRLGIFFLMCLTFAAWYGYDGFIGYPQDNLKWGAQKLPEQPPDLAINDQASEDALKSVEPGMTFDQLTEKLGKPTYEQPRQFRYQGRKIAAVIELSVEDKVLDIRTREVEGDVADPGLLVTAERVERVSKGDSSAQVRNILGAPGEVVPRTVWYLGQAAFGEFALEDGKVVGEPDVQVNEHKTEGDILLQRVIAVILLILALYVGAKLWRFLTLRVVLDDEGLQFKSKRIRYDEMKTLQTDEYKRKAWVDLVYEKGGSTQTLRLDKFHINKFEPIINELCRRQGWQSPIGQRDGETPPETNAELEADDAGENADNS